MRHELSIYPLTDFLDPQERIQYYRNQVSSFSCSIPFEEMFNSLLEVVIEKENCIHPVAIGILQLIHPYLATKPLETKDKDIQR